MPSERKRLKEEYETLHMVALKIISNRKGVTQNKVSQEENFYEICTNSDYFQNCKRILAFALRFLSRSFNECGVESAFSNIKQTDSDGRPYSHETVEKLCFIKFNGPYPLVFQSLIRKALAKRFGNGNWHFITNNQIFFTSTCITSQIKMQRNNFLYLIEIVFQLSIYH